MFNMNVFWVLFLVVLNTSGNQGDPNHGLINFQNDQDQLPLYIVSMRNNVSCHICTGSRIAEKWVLSSTNCDSATHFLYGLKEFEDCTAIEDDYKGTIDRQMETMVLSCIMYKVTMKFEHKKLDLPNNYGYLQTGSVIGWYFDNSTRIFVMKNIPDVNIYQAFSGNYSEDLCEVGSGSPLIFNNAVYGFFRRSTTCRFDNIFSDLKMIHFVIQNYS